MLEREYNVPLRREFLKAPRYKRTNRAVSALRSFISKHMKSTDVSLGKQLNEHLWQNGIKNPPHKVTVKAMKDDSGKVTVELKAAPVLKQRTNKRLARVERSEGKPDEEKATEDKTPKAKTPKKDEDKTSADKPADKKPEKPKEKESDAKDTGKSATEKKTESKENAAKSSDKKEKADDAENTSAKSSKKSAKSE